MKFRVATLGVAALTLLCACTKSESTPSSETGKDAPVTPEQAQAIAEEAFVYAYPMMENYRTMYVQAIDRTAPGYLAPFNQLSHKTDLLGPDFKDVVRPNNDTMYSLAWLDLRAQPIVVTVPAVEDRYYSVQFVDLFTHNFAYVGTRATGTAAGSYMIAGPQWKGTKPGDVNAVFRSESEFVYCIVRTEARGPDDVAAVRAVQRGYALTPLHVFLARSRAPAASGITFPAHDADKARSASFIDLLNFLLTQAVVVPEERELMDRFARIGIRPGATAASLSLDTVTRDSVSAGVGQGLIAITKAGSDLASLEGVRVRAADGWQGVDGLFGDGSAMRKKYLVRATAAMMGLYGNDTLEAYYPVGVSDSAGKPYDGSKHGYVIRFDKDEMPQIDAFWSLTMYSLPNQLMVPNPIDRYSIGDRSKLRYGKDGSLTIYVQHESPGKKRESNWLPAPDGPFSLQLRMYLPKPEALDPLYVPPPVGVAE